MMEPTVKMEPCEELYTEQEICNDTIIGTQGCNGSEIQQLQTQHTSKRIYDELEKGVSDRRNVSYHQINNSHHLLNDSPNEPHLLQDNHQSSAVSDGSPLKKYKKLEENMLFNPPFFKLAAELSSISSKEAIAARCYSCGKVVKGNRGISSNFIKHMKRSHPEINKIYKDYKTHKIKTGYFPSLAHLLKNQTVNRKYPSRADNCASGSESNAAYSNDETNQFLETNDTMEANAAVDSSDDNENPFNGAKEIASNLGEKRGVEFAATASDAFGSIIDEKLKNFVKQQEYEQLKEQVNILINRQSTNNDVSLSPAQTELKTELDSLRKECALLRLAVQQSQASKRQLQHELQTVDKLLHQRKLIIKNIKVANAEQPIKSAEKLFRDILHLDETIKIVNCSIIPTINNSCASNKESVAVELVSPQACKAVFRQAHKLKNTGIFIEYEISQFQRKRKNKLMVLRKEVLRRKPDLKVLVRDCTLVVNGKNFYWDDVEGLCHDYKNEAAELSGVEYLNLISDLNLKEFIQVLQNYNIQVT